MKKGLIYLLLLVLGTATFSSCEDDDNDGYKRISSEYKNATLKLTFNGKELNDKTVEILCRTRVQPMDRAVQMKQFVWAQQLAHGLHKQDFFLFIIIA